VTSAFGGQRSIQLSYECIRLLRSEAGAFSGNGRQRPLADCTHAGSSQARDTRTLAGNHVTPIDGPRAGALPSLAEGERRGAPPSGPASEVP
jgi:hypothetical protein